LLKHDFHVFALRDRFLESLNSPLVLRRSQASQQNGRFTFLTQFFRHVFPTNVRVNKPRDVNEGQLFGDWLERHRCLGLVCRAGGGAKGQTVSLLGGFLVDGESRY
jgi:hypothetical protein